MNIKKITITFTAKPTQSKLETLMFNLIEKPFKYFVRLWETLLESNLPSKEKSKVLIVLIIGFVLVHLSLLIALFVWLIDKTK